MVIDFSKYYKESEIVMENISSEVVNQYEEYFYDYTHDDRLDSDEREWVKIIRSDIKPWSNAEEKRTKEITSLIYKLQTIGDEWEEYYEQNTGDPIESHKILIPGRKPTEICIYKNWLTYARNWDENDNRVKRGAKVKGTVYYDVADDGDVIDETYVYKTLADAKHAAKLYVQGVRKAFGIKEQTMNKCLKVTNEILSGVPIREALSKQAVKVDEGSSVENLKLNLLQSVSALYDAWKDVLFRYESLEEYDSSIVDIFAEDYPFDKSFDDLLFEIMEWEESLRSQLIGDKK